MLFARLILYIILCYIFGALCRDDNDNGGKL